MNQELLFPSEIITIGDDIRFGKTNLVNSAIVILNDVCISLHVPQLSSVLIVQPEAKVPGIPESDFTKTMEKGGLGTSDGDLYYITVDVGSELHIITNEYKRVIVECNDDGVKIRNL